MATTSVPATPTRTVPAQGGAGADGTATHCPYCALQCGMVLRPADGGGVTVAERADFPVNRGALCGKGQTAADLLAPGARLTAPLVRDGGGLRAASWDEALDRIAAAVRETSAVHGPAAVGLFGGGGLTNEKAYLLGKFARVVLRTPTIDYNGRFCMSSAAAAGTRAFGLDRGLPFPLADIPHTGCVLLVGSNLADTMPPVLRYFTELAERGGRLVVIDPRRTRTAERADLHLQPVPGTDLALALGLLHLAIADGRIDEAFIAERTTGYEQARAAAMEHWPARVEAITGVPLEQMRQALEMFASAESGMVLTARGSEQHAKGTDTVTAWINLCLALGKAGRPHSGYGCLTGQGNGQGGREHGQKADQLPGYRKLTDAAARAHVARVWGVEPDSLPGPGPSAYELLDRLGRPDGVRTLLVMGSNPVVSAPRAAHIERRLRALDFLAVSDVVLSETAALADVVLPVAQWAEEEGTMTNLEGRVLLRRRAVAPPTGVRTDLQVISALAARLGHDRGFPTVAAEVFTELRAASAGGVADYSGIDYDRIAAEDGVFWPCPQTPAGQPPHPGTPRLFLDRFATPDGRARFVPVAYRDAAELPDAAYPLRLTTGRVLAQYQSGAQTRRVAALAEAAPGPFVELHPHLAEQLGVAEGDDVRVTSRRGSAVAPARISMGIRVDTVFMPFHWAGAGRVNTVTSDALDPVSRMPEFKVCAVRVEAVTPARERDAEPVAAAARRGCAMSAGSGLVRRGGPRRIVVVGNGMAAARLVDELERLGGGERCAVTVLGDEERPAYSRVLLPDVLAGRYRGTDITLSAAVRTDRPWVSVRRGVEAILIERDSRIVVGDDGSVHPYDALVLATGANPVLPPLRGLRGPDGEWKDGVFALRSMDDCDRLLAAVPRARRAVVIGGGVLGVGAALGLAAHAVEVEIVHQAPHLMERQLDEGAAEALRNLLGRGTPQTQQGGAGNPARHGIPVYVECRARGLRGDERVTGVELADDFVLDCDLVVLACGVAPRAALARSAGLSVGRGVVVDDTLTSPDDPRVYAIGDCAEHRGRSHGLAMPAWDQAAVLAAQLSGADPGARYRGWAQMLRLSVGGVEVAAFGGETAVTPAPGDDVLRLADATRGTYKKVVLRDGHLVGALLVGDTSTLSAVATAFTTQAKVPADRTHLLVSPGTPAPATTAVVTQRATTAGSAGRGKPSPTTNLTPGQHQETELTKRQTRADAPSVSTARPDTTSVPLRQQAIGVPAPPLPARAVR